MKRRNFLKRMSAIFPTVLAGGVFSKLFNSVIAYAETKGYITKDHYYEMGIQIDQCIGCARCVIACKKENDVPKDFFFRTWVERYIIKNDGHAIVTNISQERETYSGNDIRISFFAPKLCNHCESAPCVQVCPVEATFTTEDGVVIVDDDRCIGCRYCVQACPYGARYIHPERNVADKCTFCYHRITEGLLPACVEVCPTQARIFGDVKKPANPLNRLRRLFKTHVLKPGLNTGPKVFYTNLDGEVR